MPALTETRQGTRFLDNGTLDIFAFAGEATGSFQNDPKDLVGKVNKMNTRDYIRDRFFTIKLDPTDGSMVYKSILLKDGGSEKAGSQLSVMKPTSRYGQFDTQITIVPPNFHQEGFTVTETGEIISLMFEDLTQEAKRAYVLSSMRLLQDGYMLAGPNEKVINMENCSVKLAPKASRSIGAVHKHHAIINRTKISAEKIEVPGMAEEHLVLSDKEFMERALVRMTSKLKTQFEKRGFDFDDLTIEIRTIEPYGFSFLFDKNDPITIENCTDEKNINRIVAFKEALYYSYKKTAMVFERIANNTDILESRYGIVQPEDFHQKPIPSPKNVASQPSHREMEDVDENGYIRFTLNPAVFARGGPMESCGTSLNRTDDESIKSDTDPELEDQVYRTFADNVQRSIKDLNVVHTSFSLPTNKTA